MSVLDLSIDKQKEIAKQFGMTHAEWVKDANKKIKQSELVSDRLKRAEKRINESPTEASIEHQKRVDSENQ